MKRNDGLSGIYTVAVAGLFLAGFFLLVVFAAQTYRGIVAGQTRNNQARALLSYISTCVKANDTEGAVSVGQLDGRPVLVIADGDTGYGLRIYQYGESLLEDYGQLDAGLDPSFAQNIGTTETFLIERLADDTYAVTTDAGRVLFSVRSGKEQETTEAAADD